jgi:hypothetical protein
MNPNIFTVLLSMIVLLSLSGCDREAPQKPLGSATNKHVEESPARPDAAETLTGRIKAPMERAQQTEGMLQGAAEERGSQADQATP